ncbi:MAG: Gfo/Idh/MocA family protein [Desulfomonilaceae bacterium]
MKTDSEKISVGVVGVGSMGKNHARVLSQISDCHFAGIYDTDQSRVREICELYSCIGFDDFDELANTVEAIVIAAPTSLHGTLGERCLNQGLHILMEKPLAANLREAEKLVQLAERNQLILMVGHIERYNPAVSLMIEKIKEYQEQVVSFEARRLNPFDGTRCMDVDVLYDLLIHDVDLALDIAGSDISNIWAVGRKIYSDLIDDAHTLVQFNNGVVASFWTSRCSPRKIREINLTTRSRFYHADCVTRSLEIHCSKNVNENENWPCCMGDISVQEFVHLDKEPLKAEMEDFIRSVKNHSSPTTNGKRALDSLIFLDKISRTITSN